MKQTALITGASRGLGRVLAGFLALQGFRLVITARDSHELDDAARALSEHTDVTALAGDVRDAAHRNALAAAAGTKLDVLTNNASTLGPTPLRNLTDVRAQELRDVMDVNFVAPVALVAATLPALEAGRGLVVNVSSDAATGGYAHWGAYGASKAALELASKTLSAEMPGIHVVTVDPGDMRTQMQQAAFPDADISDRPSPEHTLPFWAWLLNADPAGLNGRRFAAQDPQWTTGSDSEVMYVS